MSRKMLGSGKFTAPVSGFSSHQEKPEVNVIDIIPEDGNGGEDPSPSVLISPVPADPDQRPKLIRYAEEYFGRYWLVTLIILMALLFRKK